MEQQIQVSILRVRKTIDIDIEGLGEMIRTQRKQVCKERNIGLESICAEVGIDRTYWYRIENETLGKDAALSLGILRKIESVLGVDLSTTAEGTAIGSFGLLRKLEADIDRNLAGADHEI